MPAALWRATSTRSRSAPTAPICCFGGTADVTQCTRAALLNQVCKRTPMLARFSEVAAEEGYPDTDRDVRGFALKFYTEEGNYDMVGNNTPVFFVRDPMKFPDFIHS